MRRFCLIWDNPKRHGSKATAALGTDVWTAHIRDNAVPEPGGMAVQTSGSVTVPRGDNKLSGTLNHGRGPALCAARSVRESRRHQKRRQRPKNWLYVAPARRQGHNRYLSMSLYFHSLPSSMGIVASCVLKASYKQCRLFKV